MTRDELVTNLIALSVGTASLRDVQLMAEAMLACQCREHETSEAQSKGAESLPQSTAANVRHSPGVAPSPAGGGSEEPAPISDADVKREAGMLARLWYAGAGISWPAVVSKYDWSGWEAVARDKLESEAKLRAELTKEVALREELEEDVKEARDRALDFERESSREWARAEAATQRIATLDTELAEAKRVGCSLYDEMRGLEQQLAAARAPLSDAQVEAGVTVLDCWNGGINGMAECVYAIVEAVRGVPGEPAKP